MSDLYEEARRELTFILSAIDHKEIKKFSVVCMPSFYLDHFVFVKDYHEFCDKLKLKYKSGGGNLPGLVQNVSQGGGAVNTAIALARLGVHSYYIGRTSELGAYILQFFAKKAGVDISHVREDGKLGQTLALEIGRDKVNVMINEVGSNYDFGFDSLKNADLELIRNCHLVSVHDWGTNVLGGTDLAAKTFAYAKQHAVKTYFDSADPSVHSRDLPELFEKVMSSKNLDIMSMNVNELKHQVRDVTLEQALALKHRIPARIDFHSPKYSVSIGTTAVPFPSYDVKLKRSTGAGDTWNAGNILGELLGLSPTLRLCFANAVAGYYVSNERGLRPTLDDVLLFIKNEKLRLLPKEIMM
ncbi:MAG TPA: carbohydrate kinase family protein [Candidatus Acidoferrales bacterium]|nr:carbohydrate kinase family protein [Candidatus Acidoferrales bacterium]